MSRGASGLRAWVLQRISAVYLAVFTFILLGYFLIEPPADFAAWRGWVVRPWVSIGRLLYIASLILHAWVGIRDVLIDYVPVLALRLTLLSVFALLLLGSGLWALKAILLAHAAA